MMSRRDLLLATAAVAISATLFVGVLAHAAPARKVVCTRAAFEAIPKSATYKDIVKRFGKPTGDIGSGIHIMTYPLKEGGRALIGTPDLKKVYYIHFQTAKEAAKWKGP